jgi:hypothetical protein
MENLNKESNWNSEKESHKGQSLRSSSREDKFSSFNFGTTSNLEDFMEIVLESDLPFNNNFKL